MVRVHHMRAPRDEAQRHEMEEAGWQRVGGAWSHDLLSIARGVFPQVERVPPGGIEPPTHGLGNRCSSPLSYEGEGTGGPGGAATNESVSRRVGSSFEPGPLLAGPGSRWTLRRVRSIA